MLYLSPGIGEVIGVKDGKKAMQTTVDGYLNMHPSGEWEISFWVNSDTQKIANQGGNLTASNFLSEKPVFLLTAFSDIWDLWRNLENLHFAFKRYKMNVYGKKISEFMKELANVKRRIFNYRCAS